MFTSFLMSLVLLGLGGLLIDSHRRSWQTAVQNTDLSERDLRFARSQYRRRMQASSIIAVLGVAIGLGPVVPRRPGPMAFYLAMLVTACGCIMVLAFLDAWASRQNFRRLHGERMSAELKLAIELRQSRESAEADG